jgi:hypothetical protein
MAKDILPWQLEYMFHLSPALREAGWLKRFEMFKKTNFKSKDARTFEAGWRAAMVKSQEEIDGLLRKLDHGRTKDL